MQCSCIAHFCSYDRSSPCRSFTLSQVQPGHRKRNDKSKGTREWQDKPRQFALQTIRRVQTLHRSNRADLGPIWAVSLRIVGRVAHHPMHRLHAAAPEVRQCNAARPLRALSAKHEPAHYFETARKWPSRVPFTGSFHARTWSDLALQNRLCTARLRLRPNARGLTNWQIYCQSRNVLNLG